MRVNNSNPSQHYRGSLFGPLLLVVVGIVLLAYNLFGLSSGIWDFIWRLWPVLFIIGALDSLWRRQGLVLPVLGLSLGVVFLLSNFNLLAWNAWSLLFQLWPIFLVALGLDLVLGRRSIWGALAGLALMGVIVAGALWYFGSDLTAGRLITDKISQSMEGAEQARISIHPAVGLVSIKALAYSDMLVEGEVTHTSREKPTPSYTLKDGTASYELKSTGMEVLYPTGPGAAPTWKLGLNDRLPIDLSLDLGVGEVNLDLSQLKVHGLDVNLGIGRTVVTLPQDIQGTIQIKGAIGDLQVIIPKGLAVRVLSETGIGNLEVPPDYLKQDENSISPNYLTAETKVDLKVSQAIGRVLITER